MKNRFFKVPLLLVSLLLFCCVDTASPQATELTVATINIRIDSKKDSLNRWEQRKQYLFDFVSQQHFDVIGLQEVYPRAMKDIHKGLPGYAIVRRENKEKRADAPILYRKSAYKKIAQGTFWLSEFPDSVGFVGWDGRHPRFVNWAVLKSRREGKVFCVANTHLDHAGRQAREEGIKLLKIDGVMPSNETIANGEYPYCQPFYAVIRADEPEDSPARRLFDWLLTEEGQALVEQAGYVPMGAE